MKIQVLSLALILGLVGALVVPARLSAQATLTGPTGDGSKRLAFLSADDRAHFIKVREQVLASHPDLHAEQESLEKDRAGMKDAAPEDRQAMREKFMAHLKKMNDAMLLADPTIKPVLDLIDAKRKERLAERAAQGGKNAPGN